jgi:hypothetical protein
LARLAVIGFVVVCLMAAAAGCGSSSSSSSGLSEPSSVASTSSPAGTAAGPSAEATGDGAESGGGLRATAPTQPQGSALGQTTPPDVAAESGQSPERSLETFGREAAGARRAEVAAAAHRFLVALAEDDGRAICASIVRGDLVGFRRYQKAKGEPVRHCPEFVVGLLPRPGVRERRAAAAPITHVKVEGSDAIVFFAPDGSAVSYLAMIRQGGRWRSVSVVPGIRMDQIGAG